MLCLVFPAVNYRGDWNLTVRPGIRFDAIEEEARPLVTQAGGGRGSPRSRTLSADLGHIEGGRQRVWWASAVEDLSGVLPQMSENLRRVGVPFLKEYSDRERALDALSDDEGFRHLWSQANINRAARALLLARELHGDDGMNALAIKKMRVFGKLGGLELESYRALMAIMGID